MGMPAPKAPGLRAHCPACGREVAYLPLGQYCLFDGYLWWYRARRWWFIHVAILGINDPEDVGPYFEQRRALVAERTRDRAGEFGPDIKVPREV